MDLDAHWEHVYRTKRIDEVSWFRPHLDTSLELIEKAGRPAETSLLDVGGGASTLVDDLLDRGYRDVSVIDLAATALAAARERLGARSMSVTWIQGDVTRVVLPRARFNVWHDRAVFHFLTEPADRQRYIEQVRHALAPGGHVIVATFGPDGPQRCSGLPTSRYDADSLRDVFGEGFQLVETRLEHHQTPSGVQQQFLYCL
jgi:ubiquinone/menaquinone biosynthesis C-methylase UbiE